MTRRRYGSAETRLTRPVTIMLAVSQFDRVAAIADRYDENLSVMIRNWIMQRAEREEILISEARRVEQWRAHVHD